VVDREPFFKYVDFQISDYINMKILVTGGRVSVLAELAPFCGTREVTWELGFLCLIYLSLYLLGQCSANCANMAAQKLCTVVEITARLFHT
jgi:hypothetical protein